MTARRLAALVVAAAALFTSPAGAQIADGASPTSLAWPFAPEPPAVAPDDLRAGEAVRDPLSLPLRISFGDERSDGTSNAVKIILLVTALTLAPAALLSVTCFTRIIIVLSLLRRAISTQEIPPNPVLVGLALFLTTAVMSPVIGTIHGEAVKPYLDDRIGAEEAGQRAARALGSFLLRQTREADIALFTRIGRLEKPATPADLPLRVLVPAFLVSELKTAFQMGFALFLPFLVIDLVISSILLSMGMFMLPPVLISTPFKLLLFVLADGWHLVVQSLAMSFR
jgi:flagellar biosynthetic protein FliP